MKNTYIIKRIINTAKGWEIANKEYLQVISSKSKVHYDQIQFNVNINDNPFDDSGDMTNLRYFFPICRDMELNSIAFRVNIFFESKKRTNDENAERITVLLSYVFSGSVHYSKEEGVLWFYSNGYIDDNNIGLAPIIKEEINSPEFNAVIERAKKEYYGIRLLIDDMHINSIFDSISIHAISDSANKKLFRHIIIGEVDSFDEFSKVKSILEITLEQYLDRFNYKFIYICRFRKRIIPSDIFPIIRIDNPVDIQLPEIIGAYTDFLKNGNNYIGTHENSIDFEQKLSLATQVEKSVQVHTIKENDLVKVIFVFILRNLLRRKELFNFLGSKNVEINESVIEKVFADAKTYSEGVYQILENSYFYSNGKCAYFGMRIHNADRHAPMSDYENEARVRVRLYNKYKICFSQSSYNTFSGDRFADYLELYIIDNAEDGNGILPDYNKKLSAKAKHAKLISEIIHETEDEYYYRRSSNNRQECISEYYLSHYGLRWFEKNVKKNNGYIIIVSPDKSTTSFYTVPDPYNNIDFSNLSFIPKCAFYTEFSILMPLSYSWNIDNDKDLVCNHSLFGDKVITDTIDFIKIDLVDNRLVFSEDKKTYTNRFYDLIIKANSKYIYFVLNQDFSMSGVEVLAKAIFKYIYLSYCDDYSRDLYYVIDFQDNRSNINEFVRIFSVFYNKAGKNQYMINVQIALASNRDYQDNTALSDSDDSKGEKEINFILGGVDYNSAYATANVFLYYNSKSTAPFIPLLKYLSETEKNDSKANHHNYNDLKSSIDIFPFDLFIKDENNQSWFTKKMAHLLENDIRGLRYGCKIGDTHIRLSSRIHLNTFFEAELLFHNISIVYRFAYLIAQKIIEDLKDKDIIDGNNIIIVGYENYSSILIQQIAFWVSQSCCYSNKVCITIVTTSQNGLSTIENNDIDDLSSVQYCYTVIPITTTMSTVYKVHRAIKDSVGENVQFSGNYAVVSVCDDTIQDGSLEHNSLIYKYWNKIDRNAKNIVLQPETKDSEGITVTYILLAESKWFDLQNCALCNSDLPLIQVDKTSTIPEAIFELSNSKRKFFSDTEDMSIFEPDFDFNTGVLTEKVLYSHIQRGNNHYQFYFRFQNIINGSEEKIVKWAKSLSIDSNAYNIVLSPLNISNAKFLKLVIDNAFFSSLRLLHININQTYKEDLRAKFSYIASDYSTIKRLNNSAKINFYYIDDSIVTGQSINRGRMFLKMLVEESGLSGVGPLYFKKIILLINRSSYDTINTFVENVDKDFYAFCNLSIPSYNTISDFCPGCAIEEKYEFLKKRSSSYTLWCEFDRLAKKHMYRTPEVYEKWLMKQISEDNTSFSLLRTDLYDLSRRKRYPSSFIKELKTDLVEYLRKYFIEQYKRFNKESSNIITIMSQKHNLVSFFEFLGGKATDDYKCKVKNYVRYLVAKKAYLRLKTMNTAYENLQRLAKGQTFFNSEELNIETKQVILKLLTNADDNETVISYVKVISREHLAAFYHIKRAAMNILTELLKAFVFENTNNDSDYETYSKIVESFNREPFNTKKYQLVITIHHR